MSWAVLRYLRVQGVSGFAPIPLDSIDECLMIRIMEEVDSKFILKNMTRVNKRMNELCRDDLLWNKKIQSMPWQVSSEVSLGWKQTLGSSKAVFRLLAQIGWLDGFWMLDEKPRGALMRVTIKPNVIESTLLAPQLEAGDPLTLQAVSKFSVHEPFQFSVLPDGEVQVSTSDGDCVQAREFFRFTGSTAEDAKARVQFYTKGQGRPLFFKLVQRGANKFSCISHERSSLHTGVPQVPVPTARQGMTGAPGHRYHPGQHYGAHYGQCAARGAMGQGVPQAAAATRRAQPDVVGTKALEQARRLQGLWRGDFGPHGTEILCITVGNLISSRFTELVGLKCSGDPNVPCGELAFRVPLSCESGGMPVESLRASRRHTCDCAFQCDCPSPAHGEGCVYTKQIYDGLTQVAEHGFQSATWNGGAVAELEDGSGDILVVWKGLFSVRFTRLSDDFAEELRQHLPHVNHRNSKAATDPEPAASASASDHAMADEGGDAMECE